MGSCFGRCLIGRNRSSIQDDLNKNLVEDNNAVDSSSIIFRIMKTKEKRHSKFIERFWSHKEMSYSRLNKPIQKSVDIPLQSLDAHSLLITNHDRIFRSEHTGMNSSPASSSLDLEWEHEYENAQNYSWLVLPEESTIDDMSSDDDDDDDSSLELKNTSNKKPLNQLECRRIYANKCEKPASRTSWSHISTPESLEWDVNEDEHKFKSEEDLLDNETIELLQEIEWLKNRALNETGENLRDSVTTETES
ncbi:uncharacterized protein LOC119078452 [Bradysia coprophila]|uniref:uncharacterized protein LOC119078452 n=1 Tax=Bradysia coprophila TaxID=38358 RepID=UPI00187DA537|nr:uncharacterized protein LOC119078452 [Bradysia coprophila]